MKDQTLFEIAYPVADKAAELRLHPNVALNQFVKTGEVIGYVQEGEGIRNPVEAPISGTITEIKCLQPPNSTAKLAHIFTMKGCDHFPRDKN